MVFERFQTTDRRAIEDDYYQRAIVGLPVPPDIGMALCQLELSILHDYNISDSDVEDHAVAVVAHHGQCITGPSLTLTGENGTVGQWSTNDEIAGIVWHYCAWRLNNLGQSMCRPLVHWVNDPGWQTIPPSWKMATVAAKLRLLHPERYRQHIARTQSHAIDPSGMIFGLRRCGRTTDTLLRAVIAVCDGRTATIGASSRSYEGDLIKQARGMCDALYLDPRMVMHNQTVSLNGVTRIPPDHFVDHHGQYDQDQFSQRRVRQG